MRSEDASPGELESFRAPVPLKLAALWASVMFLYLYGDYFGLFSVGRLEKMNAGMIPPLGPATPGVLLAVSVMMAIPSLMVASSLLLPARLSRIANLVTGVAYSIIIVLTMNGAPPFYLFLGVLEAALTLAIAWMAWRWPRAGASA